MLLIDGEFNAEASKLFKEDKEAFKKKCAEWVEKYAK